MLKKYIKHQYVSDELPRKIANLFPLVNQLHLSSEEWDHLSSRLQNESGQMCRLTASRVFYELSQLQRLKEMNIQEEDLLAILEYFTPSRRVKRGDSMSEGIPSPSRWLLPHIHGKTSFILEKKNELEVINPLFAEKGVRLTQLNPEIPEHGYSEVKSTPGGTKVRSVFSVDEHIRFFVPYTPPSKQAKIVASKRSHEEINKDLPLWRGSRPTLIHFVATLAKLEARRKCKRRRTQKQITGVSCREVFKVHIEGPLLEGNKYHWYHLIAHFLGGEQAAGNLIATSAAANYNTLEAVESFVDQTLRSKATDSIHIKVEPIYEGNCLIPEEVIFSLVWNEHGQRKSHKININPRSYRRFTGGDLEVMEIARNLSSVFAVCG